MQDKALKRFRWIGWMEGTSFLLLLCVAMPLKYMMDMPMAVRWVGSAHGLLWVAYIGSLMAMFLARSWPITILLGGILASVLPGGPFVFDRYLPGNKAEDSVNSEVPAGD